VVEFRISDWAYRLGIRGAYACVHGMVPETVRTVALAAHFDRTIRATIERFADVDLAQDDVLRGFRQLHALVHADRKIIASPENLIRLVQKRGQLPRIHPLVDIYNLVSLETQLALGAHDLARTLSPIELRETTGAEAFWPLGAGQPVRVPAGEYAYIDAEGEVICRLEARQVEKTKITVETTTAFVIIQGNAFAGSERISQALAQFSELSGDYLKAQVDVIAIVQ
jgi:DNA/RNA-binding domain of Phe-tRNA-synthetase-like protein